MSREEALRKAARSEEMRLMKLEQKKRREDAIRQKAFDRGFRAGYSAAQKDLQ